MKKKVYSYRLKQEVFLLNNEEYEVLSAILFSITKDEMASWPSTSNKKLKSASYEPPKDSLTRQVIDLYEKFTGERITDPFMLYHVKQSNYGSLCPSCNKPFRTSRAKLCAECGYHLPEGQLAGSLELDRE